MADPFTELEDALVAAAAAVPEVSQNASVFAWADEKDCGKVGLNGALKVRFLDVQSGEPVAPAARFLQSDTAVFEFRLGFKSLRGHGAGYPVMWALRQAISGLAPTLSSDRLAVQLPGFYHIETGVVAFDPKFAVWVFASMFAIQLIFKER
jgi:hypothetical protein